MLSVIMQKYAECRGAKFSITILSTIRFIATVSTILCWFFICNYDCCWVS